MTIEIKARTFQRVASAAEWSDGNPILGNGEIGVDVTNNQFRVGDGAKRWLQLPPVGVTVGQIEGLIDQYLVENLPAPTPSTIVTVTAHPTIPGAGILTVTESGSGGGGGELAITVQPQPADVHVGASLTLSADCSNASASVQWQRSADGGTSWTNLSGATSRTYLIPTDVAAGTPIAGPRYRAVFTSGSSTATTNAALVRVWSYYTFATHPQSQSVADGADATFTASGSGSAYALAWQSSADGGATWANTGTIGGTLTVQVSSSSNGHRYRVAAVHQFTQNVSYSNVAILTVAGPAAPTVTYPTSFQTGYVQGSTDFTLQSTATGSPAPSVQWQRSTNGGTSWTNVSGGTSPSLTLTVAGEFGSNVGPTAEVRYRAVWSNSAGTATSPVFYIFNDVEP